MLIIKVLFFKQLYHGKIDDSIEWPPSPYRLFQAMVNASDGSQVLKSVEVCEPPIIMAPTYSDIPNISMYNDSKYYNHERKMIRILLGENDSQRTVYYIYKDFNGNIEEISKIVRKITHVGHGVDVVKCSCHTSHQQYDGLIEYKPKKTNNGRILRTPKNGSLECLVNAYEKKMSGELILNRVCDKYNYTTIEDRRFAGFGIYDLDNKYLKAFNIRKSRCIAAWVKHLTCNEASNDPSFPGNSDTYAAGHVGKKYANTTCKNTHDRFYYIPLPSIGHEHVDGGIRRILISEPIGGSGEFSSWANNKLLGGILEDNGNSVGILGELNHNDNIVKYYTSSSLRWRSVTPVVMPRYDDINKYYDKAKIIIEQAGLSIENIRNIRLSKSPFFKFVPGWWDFKSYSSKYSMPIALWYLDLEFVKPVYGPISLGRCRFSGSGVMTNSER